MPIFRLRPRVSRLPAIFDWLVALPALLVPFFFLPFTPDALEFNKAGLLALFVFVAGIIWFARLLKEKRVSWSDGPFLRLFIVFLAVAILSWMFSAYRYVSLVGIAGYYNHPLGQIVILVAYLFLLSQASRSAVQRLLRLFVIGSTVVSIENLLVLFGVDPLKTFNNWSSLFNLVTNSTAVLALLIATSMTLALGQLLSEQSRSWRVFLIAAALISFVLLVLLDHKIGWVVLIGGLLVLLLTRLTQTTSASFAAPVALSTLIALSIVFSLVPTQRFTKVSPPSDIILDGRTSSQVTGAVLRHEPVFGTGAETFSYAFVHYRPQSYNDMAFWNLRFLKARTEFYQLLVSYGVVGTVVFLTPLVLLAIYFVHLFLRRSAADQPWFAALSAAWFGVVLSLFFFPLSFTSTFALLTLTGALLGSLRLRAPAPEQRLSQRGQRLALLSFSVFLIAGVVAGYLGSRLWLAESVYASANRGINATEDLGRVREKLLKAINRNPYESKYYLTLAETDLVRAQLERSKASPDNQQTQTDVKQAMDAIKQALTVEGDYPETYERVASLYAAAENISGVDLTSSIVEAYRRAASTEPTNPLHPLRIGQTLLTYTDSLAAQAAQAKDDQAKQLTDQRTEALNVARSFFQRAKSLKASFPPADLGLALLTEREGKSAEAVTAIQQILNQTPDDVNSWFELGRIERSLGKKDEAINAFQQVTTLLPSSAVAYYNLAQLYEEQGKKTEALAAYQQVDKLSPGITEIQDKIAALQK